MKSRRIIRIGTRESPLALYQAREVQNQLWKREINNELVLITSDGDQDLVTPLYEMGIQGIFTKSLDIALLQNRIDIAVHSAKDVPTKLAKGLTMPAMLKRGNGADCIVLPSGKTDIDYKDVMTIASSSLRRRSQWLHRYPNHRMENLRGNIQTRLSKLDSNEWDGAIFAQAAIERLEITSHRYVSLDWMLPAPAQGAIGVACREDDSDVMHACSFINDLQTLLCVNAERDFLAALHGGCAVPIAAHARLINDMISFRGNVFSVDGKDKSEVEMSFPKEQAGEAGQLAADAILRNGGAEIIKSFRS